MGLRPTLLAAVVLAVLVSLMLYLGTGVVQGITWSLGLASTAVAVTSWCVSRVRSHASKKYFNLDAESDRLAEAVRSQYAKELHSRAIYDPYPIPVTWRQAPHDVTGSGTRVGRLRKNRDDTRKSVRGDAHNLVDLFKTLPTQQYAPVREFRRRVRLALEENHLLPGDPNRVFQTFVDQVSGKRGNAPAADAKPTDPTLIKPEDNNPFKSQ